MHPNIPTGGVLLARPDALTIMTPEDLRNVNLDGPECPSSERRFFGAVLDAVKRGRKIVVEGKFGHGFPMPAIPETVEVTSVSAQDYPELRLPVNNSLGLEPFLVTSNYEYHHLTPKVADTVANIDPALGAQLAGLTRLSDAFEVRVEGFHENYAAHVDGVVTTITEKADARSPLEARIDRLRLLARDKGNALVHVRGEEARVVDEALLLGNAHEGGPRERRLAAALIPALGRYECAVEVLPGYPLPESDQSTLLLHVGDQRVPEGVFPRESPWEELAYISLGDHSYIHLTERNRDAIRKHDPVLADHLPEEGTQVFVYPKEGATRYRVTGDDESRVVL